jgi:hypothetical protein
MSFQKNAPAATKHKATAPAINPTRPIVTHHCPLFNLRDRTIHGLLLPTQETFDRHQAPLPLTLKSESALILGCDLWRHH